MASKIFENLGIVKHNAIGLVADETPHGSIIEPGDEIGWDVVRALVSYNRKNRPKFSDCIISDQKRGTHPKGNVYGVFADKKSNSD